MKKKSLATFFILLCFALLLMPIAFVFMYSHEIGVLDPKGMIALKERALMRDSSLLMLLIVIPVFVMTILFAWKYRSTNYKAKYAPNWDYSLLVEIVWWGIPLAIVFVLSLITWSSSHELDPFRPLDEIDKKPLTIQVVALDWKWLFLYPEQEIATVNFLHFPKDTPLNFELTADAPMNSFWIPRLGGQIYAMPGMKTKIHLIANETGDFRGLSSNLSGKGFAGMTFIATATSEEDFEQWVQTLQQSKEELNPERYEQLVQPSEYHPPESFVLKQKDLFQQILMKTMMPKSVK